MIPGEREARRHMMGVRFGELAAMLRGERAFPDGRMVELPPAPTRPRPTPVLVDVPMSELMARVGGSTVSVQAQPAADEPQDPQWSDWAAAPL